MEISKQYYHRTCLRCASCEKLLKQSEYNFHDLSSEGRRHFYCTLHYCKSRLKQVTTTLATATQQGLTDLTRQKGDLFSKIILRIHLSRRQINTPVIPNPLELKSSI